MSFIARTSDGVHPTANGALAMPDQSLGASSAFIELLAGAEGLCHICDLAEGYVDKVTDVIQLGETIEVVIINVDDRGKIKLSAKAALAPQQ